MMKEITSNDFSEIRWRGNWIWVPEEQAAMGGFFPGAEQPASKPESHGLFRKTFTLKRLPRRAPARITADSRYALYINGQEVYRGPIRSQPRRMHYDLFDLAPYLKKGENVIAVYVIYYGRPKSYWMPAAANMTLGKTGVMVFEANLGKGPDGDIWLVSDASWKARKSDAWSDEGYPTTGMSVGGGIAVEVLDARKLDHNWNALGYDDRAWGDAQMMPAMHIGGFARTKPPTDPYGPLYPRPIAKLGGAVMKPASILVERLVGAVDVSIGSPVVRVGKTIALPVTTKTQAGSFPVNGDIPQNGFLRLIVDMGVIVSGMVRLEVTAPAGTIFDLNYVEDPIKKYNEFLGAHSGSRYIARGKHDKFQVFDSNGFRYAYILVHGVTAPVTVNSFAVQEMLYPWQAGASFECSDADLNRLYTAGVRTVALNSHDSFMDCPTREQRAWVGDSVVHQMVHLATNTDWRLAWHYLTLGNSPRSDGILPMSVVGEIESSGGLTIPDWGLHWVHGVYNLYRFKGDKDAVKAFMPTIERILRWYMPYQTSAGALKDVVEWNLVDWASLMNEDTSGILTAVWARGLYEFTELAGWLGEKASQKWADRLYAKAKAGFEIFWNEARGTYVDHVKDGIQQNEINQLAGALAICSRLAPENRWKRIIETITDPHKLVIRSFTGAEGDYAMEKMMKQFQGIYEVDWDAEKEIVIAQPFMSYVVHDAVALAGMADRLPDLYTRWLEFLVNGYDTIGECWGWGTHVHGWSCTPTKDMVFYTLGVTPAKPGYTVARIAPRLGRLKWAKGKVPTPRGLISVQAEPGKVTVDSPVPVIVELPGRAPQSLPAGVHEVKA
jgi:alpha-L-rhamnosidase